MQLLPASELVKDSYILISRLLNRNFKASKACKDIDLLSRLDTGIKNSYWHLTLDEATVLLFGCSKLLPKNTQVVSSICSRINALCDSKAINDESDKCAFEKQLSIENANAIAISIKNILKHNVGDDNVRRTCDILCARQTLIMSDFSEKFKDCTWTRIGALSNTFSKICSSFIHLDKLMKQMHTAKVKNDSTLWLEMTDGMGRLIVSFLNAYLNDFERNYRNKTVGYDDGNVSIYLQSVSGVLVSATHENHLESVLKDYEKVLLNLKLITNTSSRFILDSVIIALSNMSIFKNVVWALLSELSRKDLSVASNSKLTFIVIKCSEHSLQHIKVLEAICNEFLQRTHVPLDLQDVLALIESFKSLSYYNEPILELLIRHFKNNLGGTSKSQRQDLLRLCAELNYTSTILDGI
ncbi:hypothetical protein BdWA1_000834 [Babesia duncani]|uniref:Uncharacterized protein n=1 Tax=Babesia duncani TaxID=323732 RepID=A0AAD9UQA7_9APIC|nr:hypothetical protein BdWA1_000834 [Babesia duncani]